MPALAHLIQLAQKSSILSSSHREHPVQVLGPFEFSKIEVTMKPEGKVVQKTIRSKIWLNDDISLFHHPQFI